jgi:two-component system, OmpR family, heavy metal sensor histidine kinase CusS
MSHATLPARSFRTRLVLQTTLVSAALVASFGGAAWWYASESLERTLDGQIAAQAQRVWNRIDPRSTIQEFREVSDIVFGSESQTSPMAMLVLEHAGGTTIYKTRGAPTDLDAYFRTTFPSREEMLDVPANIQPPTIVQTPSQREPEHADDFSDILGLSSMPLRRPPQQGRAIRFRPQMPMVRDPILFTTRTQEGDWRWGAFSNPHYTLFVGISKAQHQAEIRRMGLWYAAAASIGLGLAALAALWASRRAMRPLDRVVSTAQKLTASELEQRIPITREDDREFVQLIGVLNGMMERLEASFRQAVRFTADASHELKTPLAIMLASLDDALRTTQHGSVEHERLASLFEEATRLKTITQSLLLLSQADAGRLPTHPESYDLSADLSRLIEDGEILCEAAELTLHPQVQPGVRVHADRALMRQVLQNLLSNAIKYNRPAGNVHLRLHREAQEAIFTLTNTGPAIPAEAQPRLFERFFRGDKAHNRQTDGYGLGLNIAFELAKANQATLRLISSREDETIFEARLPLAAE